MGLMDSQVSEFNMDHFEQVELTGRQNQTIYPNGARYDQRLNVIDANHAQVTAMVNGILRLVMMGWVCMILLRKFTR